MIKERLTCTLVGSFKYMDCFNFTNDRLTAVGVKVLSPEKGQVVGVNNGFKLLNIDSHLPPVEAESGFLSSLLRSDFAYIIDPLYKTDPNCGGYLGATSVTELGIAEVFGVPTLAMEPIDLGLDPTSPDWAELCLKTSYCPLEQLIAQIEDPTSFTHQFRAQNLRAEEQIPNLEDLSLRVLSADWLKYKGLGYVYSSAKQFALKCRTQKNYLRFPDMVSTR